ncbi:hypothetical protein F0L17_01510 [Streptomyces sp. TRM43335]|uniref:Uncharacterized protein n=1 Tax=Streptomyces taklimakanensis TaxID=2569853 RepID=A0A6G2B6F5_9ACTN|nr:hypothetical protein [Streptomyces taklimakanensis]MTE17830.1 hypothetical protein [Streptomyces taklimakanensis]
MTDGETFFSAIGEILGRRHRISGLDPKSGAFELRDEDRTVRVTLDPDLLAECCNRLDEHDVPGLSRSPRDAQDRVRAKRVALWVEEIFESDISWSLLEIRLDRSADGRISLVDRRGPARRPFPTAGPEDGHWSAERPGT